MYEVVSSVFVGGPPGTVLTVEDLAGCNIPALISAGHIASSEQATDPVDPEQTDPVEPEKE